MFIINLILIEEKIIEMVSGAASNKCNIMMIGDGAVGKTSLLKMYSEGVFGESHMATLGLDYVIKNF